MSFSSWLQNLTSGRARRDKHHLANRRSRRGATRRLGFESLEDRRLLAFDVATSYPVDTSPQAVVTGDFNDDGHLDLATADPVANKLSVLLGDGAGGFGDAIDSSLGLFSSDTFFSNRISLTTADFDNDGDDDLAMVAYNLDIPYWSSAGVLLSHGDGTFESLTSLAPAGIPFAVAAGDFNNDGNIDLVVGGEAFSLNAGLSFGFVQVLPGDGQGGFAQTPNEWWLESPAFELTVGDLNGDGDLDVVALDGEYGGGSVTALLGNGTGGAGGFFNSEYDFYATSYRIGGAALGDFTGDGIPDLIVAGSNVDVFVGRGDGTFDVAITHSANGNYASGVAVADFNGDGLLDAVTCDAYTGTVSELLGNGDGTLTLAATYTVGSSPSAIVVGDFNEDGRPDVATADAGSNTVSVLLNSGAWTPPPVPPPLLRIRDVTVSEGNTGTALATFRVDLSAPSAEDVTVDFATANDSAAAGSDYQIAGGTLTIPAGQTTAAITVLVTGDRVVEPNETFFVNLSNPTAATIAGGQAVGTIVDDEPRISINNVTKYEGKNRQTTLFTFTVTLSAAYDEPVTLSYSTVNGTATSGSKDYVAKTGTLTFAPGETTKTITIEVKGDKKWEANETFYLDLFGLSGNALFTKNRGIGTILNDD